MLSGSSVVEIIKKAAGEQRTCKKPVRQKWYDAACEKARKNVFAWLNLARKKNNEVCKRNYRDANILYKKLCKEKKLPTTIA